jgi:hypothetical protein
VPKVEERMAERQEMYRPPRKTNLVNDNFSEIITSQSRAVLFGTKIGGKIYNNLLPFGSLFNGGAKDEH